MTRLTEAYSEMAKQKTLCVPEGVVLTTFVNDHQFDLLHLQVTTMPACLNKRYLVLCSLKSRQAADAVIAKVCSMHWGGP